MTRAKTKKPLTEWDKMTKQQRVDAYTALLKENRALKGALRDYQESKSAPPINYDNYCVSCWRDECNCESVR